MRRHNAGNHMISNSSMKTSYSSDCQTSARIILTNGEGLSVTACPASENSAGNDYVDIYSSGWVDTFKQKEPVLPREISIEYLYPDREEYIVTWFEMVPRVSLGLVGEYRGLYTYTVEKKLTRPFLVTFIYFLAQNCMNVCPEMDACVNTSIWCDGVNHCPSGYDESFTHCSSILKLPAEVLAALCVAIILLMCGAVFWLYR